MLLLWKLITKNNFFKKNANNTLFDIVFSTYQVSEWVYYNQSNFHINI